MHMTFKKRHDSVYPAYLRVDGYTINLEPELIQSLKEITFLGENDQFLSLVINKVGSNPYLRAMINENIAKESNKHSLVLRLRNTINNL